MIYAMGQYGRNVWAAPRGSAKSTIITEEMSILLSLVNPYFEITLGLSTDRQVKDRFDGIMAQFERNELIIEDFGIMKPKKGQALWNHGHLTLNNGSVIRGLSVMGKKRGGRPKLFILDDPENDPDSDSESSRAAVIEKFEVILFKQIIPMMESGSSVFWIGTLIDRKSFLYRATMGDDPRFDFWNRVVLKAISYDKDDPTKVSVLWPTKWPKEVLDARLEEIGTSAFCFVGGTPVRTYWGWESIDKLDAGDCVRDINNKDVLVTKTYERTANDIVDVQLYGHHDSIRCTSDHPFLVFRETPYRNRWYNHANSYKAITGSGNRAKITFDESSWVKARDLTKNDFCLCPIDYTEVDSPHDEEFWWFVGRYLSEGYSIQDKQRNRYVVNICAGPHEKHYLDRTNKWLETTQWKGKYGIRRITSGKKQNPCWYLNIGSRDLAEIIGQYGTVSYNKHLTIEAKQLPYGKFMSLWGGYLSGDGYLVRGNPSANSVSLSLLSDFRDCLLRFGIIASVTKLKGPHRESIEGRAYDCRPLYCLRTFEKRSRYSKMGYIKDGFLYTRVRGVYPVSGTARVFDIATNGTFQIPGAVVHNCSEYLNDPVSPQERVLSIDPRRNEYTVDGVFDWENPLNHAGLVKWQERMFEEGSNHRIYVEKKQPFHELVRPMYRAILFDYASGLTSYNDYSCIAVVGFDTLGTMWILHLWLGRAKDAVLYRRIYEVGLAWRPRVVGIESVGHQKSFMEAFQEYAREQEECGVGEGWRARVFPIAYPSKETKPGRISSLGWRFDSGRIKYPAHLAGDWPYSELYSQTHDFTPDLALLTHDDAIDTISMSKYVVKTKGGQFRRERGLPTLRERIIKNEPLVKGLPLLSGVPSQLITNEMTNILSHQARNKLKSHSSVKFRKIERQRGSRSAKRPKIQDK